MDEANDTLDTLPAAIAARLKRADHAEVIFDPRTDRAIVETARAHFSGRRRPPLRWAVPLGIAASLLLAFLLVRPFGSLQVPVSADDIDRSGRVDVLDVLALAREQAARGAAAGADAARIEELGYRIVSLGNGGRTP